MSIYSVKRHVFFVSMLFSSVSPLLTSPCWGMLPETEEILNTKQTQPKASLGAALEAYETKQDELAGTLFTQLAQAGAIIPITYLQHLKKECPRSIELLPTSGLKLSEDFFNASEIYRSLEGKKRVEKLAIMILGSNPHALSLFVKLYEKDTSILKHLPNKNPLKKAKNVSDLYNKFISRDNEPMVFCNCLDPNNLLFLYKDERIPVFAKAAQYFERNYKKNPQAIGQIAMNLAKLYTDQAFWAHLAVENGMNEGAALLANSYTSYFKKVGVSERNLNFFNFYASYIQHPTEQLQAVSTLGDAYIWGEK